MTTLAKPITGLISGNYSFTEDLGYLNAPSVLIILSSMMLTYSISDIIYGQVLLPMKKEKYYLYALLGGTILNIILSIVFGKYVFMTMPAVGVAVGTAVTDLLILVYLISVTWKWTKKAIFNLNSLKILCVTVLIFVITFFVKDPLFNLLVSKNVSHVVAMIIELVGLVVIDAIIYIVILGLLKEDLVSSFVRKKNLENA